MEPLFRCPTLRLVVVAALLALPTFASGQTAEKAPEAKCPVTFSSQETFIGRPMSDVALQEQRSSDGQFNKQTSSPVVGPYDLDFAEGYNFIINHGMRGSYQRDTWRTYYFSNKVVVGFMITEVDHPNFYATVESAVPWLKKIAKWDSMDETAKEPVQAFQATKRCGALLIQVKAQCYSIDGRQPKSFGECRYRGYRVFDAKFIHKK